MKLFPNKNFNKNIEDVLEKKVFSADTKSLFLSLIYKLDTAYNDYKKVKRCVKSKSEFFEEMAEVIDDYCDNIKTVKMDSRGVDMIKIVDQDLLRFEMDLLRERLKQTIALSDYSVEDISASIGKTKGTVYKYLNGTNKMSLDAFVAITSLLNIEEKYVVFGDSSEGVFKKSQGINKFDLQTEIKNVRIDVENERKNLSEEERLKYIVLLMEITEVLAR